MNTEISHSQFMGLLFYQNGRELDSHLKQFLTGAFIEILYYVLNVFFMALVHWLSLSWRRMGKVNIAIIFFFLKDKSVSN